MARSSKPFTLHLFRNNNVQRISISNTGMDHNTAIPDSLITTAQLAGSNSLSGIDALQQIGQVVRLA